MADVFVKEAPLLFAVCLGILFFVGLRGLRLDVPALTTFITAAGFLGLTCSKRFAEYSVPFLALFAGLAYRSVAAEFRTALPRASTGKALT